MTIRFRSTLIIGPMGSGKTIIATALEAKDRAIGYVPRVVDAIDAKSLQREFTWLEFPDTHRRADDRGKTRHLIVCASEFRPLKGFVFDRVITVSDLG